MKIFELEPQQEPCPDCGSTKHSACTYTHDYKPIWDSTLKAWINLPPHGKPGQGAKE